MEANVKRREARFCNLKAGLLYLVILGHLLEGYLPESRGLTLVYRAIYSFHMPLFVLLSGCFGGNAKRPLMWYLALQGLACLTGVNRESVLVPYWHLWFLLSLSAWAGIGQLFRRLPTAAQLPVIAITLVLGCLAGAVPWVGRVLSLSRTLVFLPYYLIGMSLTRRERSGRGWGPALLGVGIALGALLLPGLPTEFLYQAEPYEIVTGGILLRAGCYGLGIALSLGLLTCCPQRRFRWSRLGTDTLPVYLLHAPAVQLLRRIPLHSLGAGLLCPIWAGLILVLLYRLTRWSGALYYIPNERSGSRGSVPRSLQPIRAAGLSVPAAPVRGSRAGGGADAGDLLPGVSAHGPV